MNKYTTNTCYKYTNLENHFAIKVDEELLPCILHGKEKEILDFIEQCVNSKISLTHSLALIAYLYEREEVSGNIIKALLAGGVDPNNQIFSRIAIHRLYSLGILNKYIDLLVAYNANLNLINDNGSTVLGKAMANSDIDTMKMLIVKGASVLIQNNYGATVLSELMWEIKDSLDYDENYIQTPIETEMIELLDRSARKEMHNLGLLTEKQASTQNWRCDYFSNESLLF